MCSTHGVEYHDAGDAEGLLYAQEVRGDPRVKRPLFFAFFRDFVQKVLLQAH